MSLTRFDSMSSFARFVASGSKTCGAPEISTMRCSVAIVGLVSMAATSGSENDSRIEVRRRPQSSTWRSCSASSKTAFAYRLAAAVATGHLLDRLVDKLSVLGVIQRLAYDLLGCGHDQVRDFAAYGLHGALTLGLNVFPCGLDGPLRLLLGLLLQLLTQLLSRLRGGVDHALSRFAGVLQPGGGIFQALLRLDTRLLRFFQLLRDRQLTGDRKSTRLNSSHT